MLSMYNRYPKSFIVGSMAVSAASIIGNFIEGKSNVRNYSCYVDKNEYKIIDR